MFDASGTGLEIGPSYNPLLRKKDGYRVETLDYADQGALLAKYAHTPHVDLSNIEPVDHVSDGRSMVDVIGKTGCYDFIIASHVIEHTPDLIGFLQDCDKLLKPAGTLLLAVPDKRCCFDVFHSLTSTGDTLEAYHKGRTHPGYGAIFDAVAYGATRNGDIGWPKEARDNRQLFQTLEDAYRIARASRDSGIYTDIHVWRFVPASFELILHDLAAGGEISLRVKHIECLDEMLVALDRTGRSTPRTRLELLETVLDQQAVSSRKYGELAQLAQLLQEDLRNIRNKYSELTRQEQFLQDDLGKLRKMEDINNRQNQVLKREIQDLNDENQELSQLSQERQQQIDALRASTSWKVTHPMR